MTEALRLHGYWRSSAAYRVRIALALKNLRWETITHDLRANEQQAPDFLTLAPQGLVPVLEAGTTILTQSPAIIEWLEETYPTPPLLPHTPADRAAVRAMTAAMACEIHPLHNLRVLRALKHEFNADEKQTQAWAAHWVRLGLDAVEILIGRHGRGFAFGNTPTVVDCYLVPQLYAARRFGVDLTPFPRVAEAGERAAALPAVAAVHPDRQPGAPG